MTTARMIRWQVRKCRHCLTLMWCFALLLSLDVKFTYGILLYNSHYLNTQCKVCLPLSNGFKIDYHCGIVRGNIYKRRPLNIDTQLLKSIMIDGQSATVSSAPSRTWHRTQFLPIINARSVCYSACNHNTNESNNFSKNPKYKNSRNSLR